MMKSSRRVWAVVLGEFAIILFLSSWLYVEYLNNAYMRRYVDGLNLLPVLTLASSVAFGIATVAWVADLHLRLRKPHVRPSADSVSLETDNNSMLDAEKVTKIYPNGASKVTAVDETSMRVNRGEMVLIMGPSGSGKTTLLSMVGTLLKPTSGSIRILGQEITTMTEADRANVRRRKLGFVFQSFNLLSSLSAIENVEVAMTLAGVKRKEAFERAAKLLTELGLESRLRHLPRDLSGGEKQRVATARALANDPEIILADEPTGNLDSKAGRQVVELLHKMAKEHSKAVVIVSHDLRIRDVADRVLWLEDGRLLEESEGIGQMGGIALEPSRAGRGVNAA